ncbi:hypothetical protein BC833DRAFT_573989 [Globomyces pollinis-pini]|nr:hypothetical protein BC833DRAFT_573989 [Globomyces pollinis-pini]
MQLLSHRYLFGDVIMNLFLLSIVFVCYYRFFLVGLTVHPVHHTMLIGRFFKHIVKPLDQCATNPALGYQAFDESSGFCQMDLDLFYSFCQVFGLKLSMDETLLLFKTLDVSGNGYLSWGEISMDYFNGPPPENRKPQPAFEYYANRWRRMGRQYGKGLERIELLPYEKYNVFDYVAG